MLTQEPSTCRSTLKRPQGYGNFKKRSPTPSTHTLLAFLFFLVLLGEIALAALALASTTATDYEPGRQNATLLDGESPREARERLGLDGREAAWRAAEGLGCQAAVASGLLGLPGGAAGCVGHVVTGGVVLRADNDTTGEYMTIWVERYAVGRCANTWDWSL